MSGYKVPPGSQVEILTELKESHAIPVVDLNDYPGFKAYAILPADLVLPPPEGGGGEEVIEEGYASLVYPTGASETLTGLDDLGTVSQAGYQTTIVPTTGPCSATLEDGTKVGALKQVRLGDTAGAFTLYVTGDGFTSATFAEAHDSLTLMWAGTYWVSMDNAGVDLVA
jgi:hypothetical protein